MKTLLVFFLFFLTFLSFPLPPLHSRETTKPLSSVDLLKELIQINTSNPPGNEIHLARFIKNYLAKYQIPSEIIESRPGRGNLIARLKGSGKKEPLALLGHLDVVPADPKEWSSPPFEAKIDGDYLYGRGALDMKGLVALEINTLIRLKQENVSLAGDVILVLAADEEAGGKEGAQFLVENHWDKIKAKYVFNEGSIASQRDKTNFYPVQVAEKGVAWLKMTAQGASGHGSMPRQDNAVLRLIQALNLLTEKPQPIQKTQVVQEFLNRLAEKESFSRSWLMKHFFSWPVEKLASSFLESNLREGRAFNAMIRNTITPTMLEAGYKINVIPAWATAFVDTRILPGFKPELFKKQLEEKINDPNIKIEIVMQSLPNESDFHTPYFEIIEKTIRGQDPTAIIAPYLSPGATDSRFFREKSALCYGIIPVVIPPEDIDTIHGKNERVKISEIEKGEKILYEIVTKMQGEN